MQELTLRKALEETRKICGHYFGKEIEDKCNGCIMYDELCDCCEITSMNEQIILDAINEFNSK